jgi:hypothetical protein
MLAARPRCAQLDAIQADLDRDHPNQEMTSRYRRLDSLLVSARQRIR